MQSNKNILSVKNAKKHFGGVVAINDVSITAIKGNITGLIGPNGAGKTTSVSYTHLTLPTICSV